MFQPLRSKGLRSQQSQVQPLQCPTKGWYVGTNVADAPEGSALTLDNAFPKLDDVRMRGGALPFATGMRYPVLSLVAYRNGIADQLFAVANGAIYDVSSFGPVGAPLVGGLSSSAMQPVQFAGTGGTVLLLDNGVDAPQIWTGTAWTTTPALGPWLIAAGGTQATPPDGVFTMRWVYNHRLYGVTSHALNAYYLGLDAIGGPVTQLPMAGLFRLGGTLLCGGTWAVETTTGALQACVFITSEGEVAVFSGDYPGATNWTNTGVYKVARPLGIRCLMRAGGDLAIITQDGIVPMSKVVTLDQVALQNQAVTLPIAPAYRDAVVARQGMTGWEITIWDQESLGILNLPKLDAGDFTQFVANVRTGAWCRYIGWDANCFAVFQNQLYFGTSDGRVMMAETGGQDDGRNYTATIFPAFAALGTALRKQVKMVRPFILANFNVAPKITLRVDYDQSLPPPPDPSPPLSSGAKWDVAQWDVDVWGADLTQQSAWRSISETSVGSVLAPVIQVTSGQPAFPDFRLTATEILFETGSPVA